MKIQIFSTFWNPLNQDSFTARLNEGHQVVDYKGEYEAGAWAFKLFDEKQLVLESQRVTLSKKDTFLGHQAYRIYLRGKELAELSRLYARKRLAYNGREYAFPKLLQPTISGLNLRFSLATWIHRRKVKSYCTALDEERRFLSIAVSIFTWLTWNAIPAD